MPQSSSTPISIFHSTPYPKLPFLDMKTAILGSRYDLSLSFVGEVRARSLNEQYRGKSYTPDILSFPLTTSHGEIVLCMPRIRAVAPRYSHSVKTHVGFLFIHGLLHLKGYVHGDTMERAERRYCNRFAIPLASAF